MKLNIIKYGDLDYNKLRVKNVDVKKENPFLQQLIDDMLETIDNSGVGLAAPQVGHNLNLFIIKTPEFREVFINPDVHLEGVSIQVKEGCLSLPIEFAVNRREKIKIRYFNRDWIYRISEFDGTLAIIVQHEYDHLIGKLIID